VNVPAGGYTWTITMEYEQDGQWLPSAVYAQSNTGVRVGDLYMWAATGRNDPQYLKADAGVNIIYYKRG